MNALDNATELITSRLKALEFTYATMSSYSPTASEVAVKGIFRMVALFDDFAYSVVKLSSYPFTPQHMPPMDLLLQDMK
ncbi:hypothetical protein SNOG_02872 [Parastagonospora nodorum SN15]|uniref:Uncharacterized protein n=1 Tax=Phaeosphaeria nodorum (strain SN15 / ATCC MYA-4574 / FGSC 10173) TaxID=321614 RepID=Q0UZE2_PHANO|nr:hypothetical protein SNOG_02872 [Parastagonospora nodorum SN15]EAT89603.1 hypothetical protein SNOG_02872 [Parastagonospora nodorum SN15]